MYYRIVRFKLSPGKLDVAKAIFADFVPQVKAQPGFKGIVTFGDEATGAFGISTKWESAEAGENIKSIIGPQWSKYLTPEEMADTSFGAELFKIFE